MQGRVDHRFSEDRCAWEGTALGLQGMEFTTFGTNSVGPNNANRMKRCLLLWAMLFVVSAVGAQSTIEFGPDTSICEGEFAILDVTHMDADNYLWQDGSSNSVFIAAQTGTYWVLAKKGLQHFTDTIEIVVHPIPGVDLGDDLSLCPWDSESPLTLTGPPGMDTYFWTIDGPGSFFATSRDVVVDAQLGAVLVQLAVTDSNDCSNKDDLIIFCNLGIGVEEAVAENDERIEVYPNPVSTQLTLRASMAFEEAVELRLLDLSGRVMMQEQLANGWTTGEERIIDVSTLPAGSYFLHVSGKSFQQTHRVLKAR